MIFGPKDESEVITFAIEGSRVSFQHTLQSLMNKNGITRPQLDKMLQKGRGYSDKKLFCDVANPSLITMARVFAVLGRELAFRSDSLRPVQGRRPMEAPEATLSNKRTLDLREVPEFAFCESVTATGTTWHIRKVDKRLYMTGGIDTPSLCGRVTTKLGGWDLNVRILEGNLHHACHQCVAAYRESEASNASSEKPVS